MNNTVIMNRFLVYAGYANNKPHSGKITPFSSAQVFSIFLASLGAVYFCFRKVFWHNKYSNSKMDISIYSLFLKLLSEWAETSAESGLSCSLGFIEAISVYTSSGVQPPGSGSFYDTGIDRIRSGNSGGVLFPEELINHQMNVFHTFLSV